MVGKLESGRTAKTESGVLKTIVWPHTCLGGRLANPTYEKLDFQNLCIGEIGVIEKDNITREERKARCTQLKKILTFSRRYSWD